MLVVLALVQTHGAVMSLHHDPEGREPPLACEPTPSARVLWVLGKRGGNPSTLNP